jgi:hypothetical protein
VIAVMAAGREGDTMQGLTPETGYLRDLARAWATQADGAVPAPAGLPGNRFLRLLANQPAMQALLPFLDRTFLPEREQQRIDAAMEVSRRRTTVMLLELERILPALAEVGCVPVVLKGGSLALTVYPQPEQRWFADLDLLVRRSDLPRVYDTLNCLGYRDAETICGNEYYEKHHFHRVLVSNQGLYVEVHWALTMPASVYTYDLDTLFGRCLEIPLGHASFLAPHAGDQILHGALQSIAGGFSDLRRILDLHLLDGQLDDDERRRLCARALAASLRTGLWLEYRLREQILDAPIPGVVDEMCRPAPALMRVFDHLNVAAGCLVQRARTEEGYGVMLHWLCIPSRQRSRELRRYVFPDDCGLLLAGLGRTRPDSFWQRSWLHLQRTLMAIRLYGRVARAAV